MTDKKTDENADPMADRDNIARSFPNRVDQSGTPDTQPDQPAGALGAGQVSADSLKKEAEELESAASKGGKKNEGLKVLSEEEKAKAAQKVRDGSEIEGGHSDATKDQLKADLESAKERDKAKDQGEEPDSNIDPSVQSDRSVVDKDASKK